MATQLGQRGRLLLAVLLLALVVSSWRTLSLEGQKREVASEYQQARQELGQLVKEHGLLEKELEGVRGQAATATEDVQALRKELARLQQNLDETATELASTQHEREALQQENATLAAQFEAVTEEKQQLEAKLSSMKELRLAIRAVREKMAERRWAAWHARIAAQKAEDDRWLAEGNRGYIVRNGVPTLGVATRLQVRVLDPQSK